MIRNNSYYKGEDFLNVNGNERMFNYFNPYEYNFESDLKDKSNMDIKSSKSKSHNRGKIIKK